MLAPLVDTACMYSFCLQINYAALDAWAGLLVYRALLQLPQRPLLQPAGVSDIATAASEVHI